MPTATAIHIGLNYVDPAAYEGWDGELAACENDATALEALTQDLGYDTTLLLTADATVDAVFGAIDAASAQLVDGDICVITYAGHGGQFADLDGEESDEQDETWLLYDREILDDEIRERLAQFASGVRVVVLSDSCHSGTVVRAFYRDLFDNATEASRSYDRVAPKLRTKIRTRAAKVLRLRGIPPEVQAKVLKAHKAMYLGIRARTAKRSEITTEASVILISGCQDNQESGEKDGHGYFTAAFLAEFADGAFTGDYPAMHSAIVAQMPPSQTPNYMTDGVTWPAFEAQVPLTVETPDAATEEPYEPEPYEPEIPEEPEEPGTETGTAPWVSGPSAPVCRADSAPSFDVHPGSQPYYIFEITSDPDLFDGELHEDERSDSTWYSSWDDPAAPVRLEGDLYWLPEEAWEALRGNDQLWFRIGTTPRDDSWDGYTVSTADDDGANAPSIQVISSAERSRARELALAGG